MRGGTFYGALNRELASGAPEGSDVAAPTHAAETLGAVSTSVIRTSLLGANTRDRIRPLVRKSASVRCR
jgi:hypothetical protein